MIIKDILKQALALTIMSLAINCNAFGQVAKSPKHEVRAVWLTTLKNLDWPKTFARDQRSIEKQKKELCDILDEYQKANIIYQKFFYTYPCSVVFYNSFSAVI